MKIINFNKYIPTIIDDFIIHKDILQLLQNTISNSMQNILIYGREHVGKKTILNAFVRKLYNLEPLFSFEEEEIETNIFIKKHKYFIKITIENKTNIDEKFREILSNIINIYYNHKVIYTNSNIRFKLLIIENIHYLDNSTLNFICKKMEKNVEFRRFIFLSKTISKLSKLSSYCNNIRVPKPTNESIEKYFNNIIIKEELIITEHKYNYILSNCKSNIVTLNLLLQYYIINAKFKIIPTYIDNLIESIIKIIKSKSLQKNTKIPELTMNLLNYGLTENDILHLILKILLDNEIDYTKCCNIVNCTATYDLKLKKSSENKLGLIAYIIDLASIYS